MQTPVIDSIYRHLIKGLQAEAVREIRVAPDIGVEWDRNFAFKHIADENYQIQESESQEWISKRMLLTQHDFPDLAKVRPEWNPTNKNLMLYLNDQLEMTGNISTLEGRKKIERWVRNFLGSCQPFEKAYHPDLQNLQLVGSSESSKTNYTDGKVGPVSIASVESLRDLEAKFGHSIDPRRFRINLFVSGVAPWDELSWSGKRIKINETVLEIAKPIGRCPNIDVDAESGARKDPIFSQLKEKLGHSIFGVRAHVISGGSIRAGDSFLINVT